MSDPAVTPQDLDYAWRQRLQAALREYEVAKAQTAKLWDEQVHGLTPHPDGTFAFQRALQQEIMALNEYRRVLDVYYQLAVHGNKPQTP